MKYLAIPLCATLLAIGTANAAEVDLSKLPPASKQQGVTYAKDIRPILEASCFRCHGDNKPKGDLRLNSLEGVLKGSHDGKVVVPGDSEKSSLVIAVAQINPKLSMPPKPKANRPGQPGANANSATDHPTAAAGPAKPPAPPAKPLTPEQVGLVRAWIDQGAK